nr:sporulation transcriptional regulator WhiH [Dactylosporangium thailandense]
MRDIDAPSGDRLYDRVVEHLGKEIVTGRIAPGSPVSPERLAEELQVSRPVLREAFRTLQSQGLLVARPKIGTRVADPSAWNYLDSKVIAWRLASNKRDEQVAELYAMRLAVEPLAARMTADRATPHDLARLTKAIDAMYVALDERDTHTFTAADIDFHLALLEFSGNSMFACLSSVIASAVRTRETLVFPVVEAMRRGLLLHRQLVQAIMTSDPAIEQTARQLIVEAQNEAERALGNWSTAFSPAEV